MPVCALSFDQDSTDRFNIVEFNQTSDIFCLGSSSLGSKDCDLSIETPAAISITFKHDSSKEVNNSTFYNEDSDGIHHVMSQPNLLEGQAVSPQKSVSQNNESSIFVRNSRFTKTYKVASRIDSEGKKLPGPGVKAGSKMASGGQIKQSNSEEKPKIHLPRSITKQPEVSGEKFTKSYSSLEKLKQTSVTSQNRQGSAKPAPELKSDGVKKSATKAMKSFKPGNLQRPESTQSSKSSAVGSRLSVKLKPSSIDLANKTNSRSSSSGKINSTEMKPPSAVPAKPPVPNPPIQSHVSKLQPSRFQSRPSFPISARGDVDNQGKGTFRPAASGLRPPSSRAMPSGIARLAGRQSLSGSRLPLPGKMSN